METKKSFLIYNDLKLTLDKLPNDLAGELFKMIIDFANDEQPTTENLSVDIAFSHIKAQMIRDSKTWESKSKERSYSGRMGNLKKHHEDLYNSVKQGIIDLEKAEKTAKYRIAEKETANTADTVTVNDTVTVTDNVNGKPKKPRTVFTPPLLFEVVEYFVLNGYSETAAKKAFDYYDVADWKDSKGTKVKSWKQKMQGVWFKEENLIKKRSTSKITMY